MTRRAARFARPAARAGSLAQSQMEPQTRSAAAYVRPHEHAGLVLVVARAHRLRVVDERVGRRSLDDPMVVGRASRFG
jgi:hypothetical protein